jgi:hypothetical protein
MFLILSGIGLFVATATSIAESVISRASRQDRDG